MAFVSEMVDQLRDLLNDVTDSQVPFATKKLFLNRGINRLYPHIFRLATTTIALDVDVRDYALATTITDGVIVAVELETEEGGGEYERFDGYDIISGDEDLAGYFRIRGVHPGDGLNVRIRYAAPIAQISAIDYDAAQIEQWVGPDRALGLPVLYAMGMIAARKLDDRQDTTRYSTTQALNGVTDQDIMGSSQMWFGQFESELLDMERPLPIARD